MSTDAKPPQLCHWCEKPLRKPIQIGMGEDAIFVCSACVEPALEAFR